MGLDVGGIDGSCCADNAAGSTQRVENILPYALLAPAVEAVVNRCIGSIISGTIAPSGTCLQHMNNARNDPAIIHPMGTATTLWQPGLDPGPLFVTQPEQMLHDPILQREDQIESQLQQDGNP